MEIGIFLNEGNKQIKFLRFTQSAIDIGRSQGCHLYLNDPMLAQVHGSIFLSGEQLFVDRADSRLMIKVNDRIIEGPTLISSDDIVSLGSILLCAQILEDKAEQPMPPMSLSDNIAEQSLRQHSTANDKYDSLNLPNKVFFESEDTLINQEKEPLVKQADQDTSVPAKAAVGLIKPEPSLSAIYDSLTPIPSAVIENNLLETAPKAVIETKVSSEKVIKEPKTNKPLPKLITDLFSDAMCRLLEREFVEEVHCSGAQTLSCKSKGIVQHLSDEAPFENLEQAQEVCETLIMTLSGYKAEWSCGRLGDFWIYANRNSLGEAKLCFKRLKPIETEDVIAKDLLPQLGKFIARGARFAIASPPGQEHVAESVAAVIMQSYCESKRFACVGVQQELGQDVAWFDLPFSDFGLDQAASLMLEGLIIADHPALTGSKVFEVLATVPSSMILLSAKNPEAAFHKIRWRSVNKHLANHAVNMVLFAKEVNGKPRLRAVYSYASGEKVYGR